VRAYEATKPQQQELPLNLGESIQPQADNQVAQQAGHPAKPQ
jgi:hypothetical protein